MKRYERGSNRGNAAECRLEWPSHAVLDLKAISEYIEQDRSQETENRAARAIYDAIQSLRTTPRRGRHRRVESTRELAFPASSDRVPDPW